MLLSDKRILQEQAKGSISISPFNEQCLGTNSYDVHIGRYYYRSSSHMAEMHISSLDDVLLFWGQRRAATDEIPVEPGDTILAHTVENIETKDGITFKMYCRSTIGRCGLSVCKCSGLGDVGYKGRLTMEISNHTRTRIWIPVHMRIAQIVFEYVGETLKDYQGKYGHQVWEPENMLPKPYLDFDYAHYRK